MTLAVPRHACPHEALGDRLRRWLSPALSLLAGAWRYLFDPLPPTPPVTFTYGMGTIPVTPGAPWETVTAELEVLTEEQAEGPGAS